MKNDFARYVNDFYRYTSLSKSIISFFTLISKKENPLDLGDYRPICLVGCLYKFITKMLASRLKIMLHVVLSGCQITFMPSR